MSERVMKERARPRRRSGEEATAACSVAQRRAALILEVLAGVRSPQQAAGVLKVSSNYYYLLERKALAGLVAACQPQPKGQRADHEKELTALRQALARCEQERERQAALVRATQRAVGVPVTPARSEKRPEKPGKSASGKSRRRRAPAVRALRAARQCNEQALAAEQGQQASHDEADSIRHEGATQ
jgi:hypothetical protein